MYRTLASLLCLLPMAAHASCPSRANLVDGIVLVQNQPHFRRADIQIDPRGLREDRRETIGGTSGHSTHHYSHVLAPRLQLHPRQRIDVTYHGDLPDFDRLDQLGKIAIAGTLTINNEQRREFTTLLTFLEPHSFAIGACRYDVWRLSQETVASDQPAALHHIDYAPDLGLVLASRSLTLDGKLLLDFTYGWIGTKSDVKR